MSDTALYLIDTSAAARANEPEVRAALAAVHERGAIATCPALDLEALYSARDPADYERRLRWRRTGYVRLGMDDAEWGRAVEVQRELAGKSQHRAAGIMDLLIAACAERHSATVVHYDADYEAIAEVTGQPVRWVVPRGSVH